MTFTKTSQKFGQWSDARASTVYGLGFGSESDLIKVNAYPAKRAILLFTPHCLVSICQRLSHSFILVDKWQAIIDQQIN